MEHKPSFRQLQASSQRHMDAQVALAARTDKHFSLAQLIVETISAPKADLSKRGFATDLAYEASESCRAQTGAIPSSMWMPLSFLARDLSSSSDTGLGAVAANTIKAGSILQASVQKQSALFAGATVLTGLQGGEFDMVGIEDDVDLSDAWQGEIGTAPTKEPTFNPITLTPMSVAVKLLISRVLLMNRNIDLETGLRNYFLGEFLDAVERAAVNGDGVNQPAGLLGNAGLSVLSAGANGLAPTWDHMVELEYDASTRASQMTRPAFITSPKLRKKLRKTARATGLDFILPERGDELLGNPLLTSTSVPDNLVKGGSGAACSAMIYGDLSELIIGFFGPAAVDLLVDPVTRASDGLIKITARASVAVAPRNIGAFAAYKDLLGA